MASYRVLQPFVRFLRGYKVGKVLTDADLACWTPDTAREQAIKELVAAGRLSLVPASGAPVKPAVAASIPARPTVVAEPVVNAKKE